MMTPQTVRLVFVGAGGGGADIEHLVAARALIARGWCQGADAKDAKGRAVDATSTRARSWCVLGAVVGADPKGFNSKTFAASCDLLQSVVHQVSLSAWNDYGRRTQADVLAVFDGAIAKAASRKGGGGGGKRGRHEN